MISFHAASLTAFRRVAPGIAQGRLAYPYDPPGRRALEVEAGHVRSFHEKGCSGPGLINAALAITLVLWPEYARLIRSQVILLREMEFVSAAVALGASPLRALFKHILPNALPLMSVKFSLDMGNAILLAASLSFVGLGAVPPTPEWGAMIAAGRHKFFEWWLATFPGLAIFTTVIGFNFLGDGLRDLLDPRLSRRA